MILKNMILKFINDAIFGKPMENMRKHRDTELVTRERRRNYLIIILQSFLQNVY